MPNRNIMTQRAGIIDLGSNSARLVVAEYAPGQAYRISEQVSRRVRLSANVGPDGALHPDAMDRALKTLVMFRTFLRARRIRHVIPVATAAVRDASNQAEFLRRVRLATGLRLRVLTGRQEAFVGALGAINSTGLREGIVMDVGGGSAEFSLIRKGRFRRGLTLPLGAVRLTEAFFGKLNDGDVPAPAAVERLAEHIAAALEPLDWLEIGEAGQFVGLGGTVRALARIDREAGHYPLGLVHGYRIKRRRLDEWVDRLRRLAPKERSRTVDGLASDRGDIILAGAMVVAAALRRVGADRLLVSGQGLREGLLYQELLLEAASPVLRNTREFSVLNLARHFDYDEIHSEHVYALADALFAQLQPITGYDAAERQWLWAAAQLHDIGTVVDYYDHHKHSAYILLGAGLPGYTHRELVLIAQMCLYHRKGQPSLAPYESMMKSGDPERLSRLAALLRLAEYLDRGRAQAVAGLRLHFDTSRARLAVRARPGAEAAVEVWEAQRNADLFEAAYGLKLEIELA